MVLKFTTKPNAPLMLDQSFRVLPSYSVLTCSLRTLPVGRVERLYGLGPVCNFLTKNEVAVSLSTLSLLNNTGHPLKSGKQYFIFFLAFNPERPTHLYTTSRAEPDQHKAVLEDGIPFNKTSGDQWWYDRTDSKLNKIFNKGMFDHSTFAMKKILEIYGGFEGLKTLVDVGGWYRSHGINFDLPHVIENAPTYPGVEHVGGYMFSSVPKRDSIFMKFLNKCYEDVPDNGKMIVADSILPDYTDPSLATKVVGLFDCTLWATNH
ncbi:hypothetical protein V6Z11_A12G283400, partial [Gossypium hirsutum]